MGLNTLEKLQLDRQIARLTEDIRRVERMLQGQPIETVRIADLAVTSAKIESLVASKVDAATLSAIVALLGDVIVGGTDNDDGTIVLRNAADETIITLNKDGIEILDGKIVLKNDDATTIIDSIGLVSTASFDTGAANGSGSQQLTTTDAWTDMDDMEHEITLVRATKVLFGFTGQIFAASFSHGDAWNASLALEIGATIYPNATSGWGQVAGNTSVGSGDDRTSSAQFAAPTFMIELGSGTHTCKIQYFNDSGAGNLDPYVSSDRQFWYIMLGT